MAEEAFALSPIAARASLPSEADYEAIREAFMETARGRWFLSEYGKRNRNADTSMVLDAVARIETTLAAQKQAPANALIDSLGAIRVIVGEARAGVALALAALEVSGTLAAAHEGVRIIREVAWTLRECGADARICDLLDAQVNAIDSGHRQIAAIDRDEVLAAFDLVIRRIADLAGDEAAASPPHEAAAVEPEQAASSAPVVSNELQQAASNLPEASASEIAEVDTDAAAEMAMELPPDPADTAAQIDMPEAVVLKAAAEDQTGIAAQAATIVEPNTAAELAPAVEHAMAENDADVLDLETALDVAVLDLVAMEMAALDFADEETTPARETEPGELASAEPIAAEPSYDEPMAVEPVAAESVYREASAAMAETMVMESAIVTENPPPPSLGAALLARGMVAPPAVSNVDPLAPIRRMSQAEKIAFFS
ncbi:MAG: hypothetical protein HXX15_01515 [Rhodopseudomonas sp.]|uniref:hypothetical protein n=1 Tax=Rhodopseudomonas sp. TaxID=1078 RepID=UPI001844B3EB|nr:hypothetical protein [Rhodopseudomonas sp.]NVN84740.1 hypothetical protein [Rhodopseudomonas sp.]